MTNSGTCPRCGCELHAKHICPKILLRRRKKGIDEEAEQELPRPVHRRLLDSRDRIDEGFRLLQDDE